jgi:DNA-binding PadR family transcriptional regulator
MHRYPNFFEGFRGRFGVCDEHWEAHASGRGPRHGGGGRGRGGPFGFGGGFPFGGFPGPFMRGPRARRGDVRAGILALLAEAPRNGYQIMQELEARSRGLWRPSPGSVYPALQQLEDEGLVRSEEAGAGRSYQLTDSGKKYVAEHKDETEAPWDWQASAENEEAFELLAQVRHIGAALWQIVSSGEPSQIAEARKVLKDTRRALYGILSQDPEADE